VLSGENATISEGRLPQSMGVYAFENGIQYRGFVRLARSKMDVQRMA